MFLFLLCGTRRRAMQELISELYTLNKQDYCFDPIGSVDKDGLARIIEVIARGSQTEESKDQARAMFKRKRK